MATGPVNIAVVGLGNFGRLHAQTVYKLGDARLAGIVDANRETLAAARQQFTGVPAWADLDGALSHCEAEAWIVASSTSSHVPIAQALLAAGKKVLVEKPLTEHMDEAMSLARYVAADSANLMMGHIVLFNSEFRQLQDEVERRGPPTYIDCVRHRPISTMQYYPGEDPFHLTMVHDLYCVLALMQRAEPAQVSAHVHRTKDGKVDLALARLQWQDGTMASLTASFLTPPGMPDDGFDRLELFGQGWAARLHTNPRPIAVWDDRARWPMALEIRADGSAASGMLAEQLRTFCRVVRGYTAVPVGASYADALQVQRWLKRLGESAHVSPREDA